MALDDAGELRLVRHLFSAVKGDLTGRSVPTLIADGPRDALHAGVLLPLLPQPPLTSGAPDDPLAGFAVEPDDGVRATDAAPKVESDSSLSVDFQIRLAPGSDEIALRIQPRLSVYFAVLPSLEETRAHNLLTNEEVDDEAETGSLESDDDGDPEDAVTDPDADLLAGSDKPSLARQVAIETSKPLGRALDAERSTVMLPRKFRRHEVAVPPIELSIDPRRISQLMEIRNHLVEALRQARETIISENLDLWRHIGRPADGRRDITGRGILESPEEFAAAVAQSATGEAALPVWRAVVTLQGTPVLERSEQGTSDGTLYRISVSLLNTATALPREERARGQIEELALFDCGLSVEVLRGDLVPFQFAGTPEDYRLARDLPAIGSNCVAECEGNVVRSDSVPLFYQPWYRTSDTLAVRFGELDDAPDSRPLDRLDEMSAAMHRHLADWDAYLASDARTLTDDQARSCAEDRDRFAAEAARFDLGIQCLRRDPRLLRAFRLMNAVFRDLGASRTPPVRSWRLFQIAFIVMELPALAVREVGAEATDELERALEASLSRVDVLWFPTGGGKTEAYLGLIATALFFDRLRGKGRGTTAWMRFPLRMLSLQQLERLARVLARAEMKRGEEADLRVAGGDPFAIGYYVGGGNTPNRVRQQDLQVTRGATKDWDRSLIIRRCPFCDGPVSMGFDQQQWRLAHVCSNPQCYSNTAASLADLRGSLPILIVDNEVYRYRPSVLVGTVDKLAVLGFQRHFAHITSAVTQRCPVHGYASFGQCVEAVGGGPCKQQSRSFVSLNPERDPVPALLLQDELHLLKEELGTFNAHYEGFMPLIAEKQGYRPPKVLAATATIEAYDVQTFHLYLRDALRFPQPSWRHGESFYATSSPLLYRRLYAGVMTHQRNPEAAALRALEVYHREILRLATDPVAAVEEIGLDGDSPDDLADTLRLYDLSLTYVNRKATGGDVVYKLHQAVSPRLPRPLSVEMLTGDNSTAEVGQVIERIERERSATDGERLDALVATSLISHGVDLERINFMCMVGMPSRYAEYIQASSRAARNHVGFVLVCFKRRDLRERSQYHYFLPNHRYLDRLVESVPINRFSAFAAERTVPGLMAGLLLSHYSRDLFNRKLIGKPLERLQVFRTAVENGALTREMIEADVRRIVGTDDPRLDEVQRSFMAAAVDEAVRENWDRLMRSLESGLMDAIRPMSSFRDVDEVLDFVSDGPASMYVERLRAR